jgi:hypothetical protein
MRLKQTQTGYKMSVLKDRSDLDDVISLSSGELFCLILEKKFQN